MQLLGLPCLLALAASAAAYDFTLGVEGYYNGIDTIGGSGSTAHFQGVVVTCKNGKELCRISNGDGITCNGDKTQDIECKGLAIQYQATLNCGKEKITNCKASAPGAKTISTDDLSGGYSNIGIGSSETSRCQSAIMFTFDDGIPNPCA